jgi:ABC-2 type transport system permease protein
VVVMPITFLGCVYYPWAALGPQLKWLQRGVLVNPIVYMSEGLRASLTPTAHMPAWLILTMLSFFLVLLSWLGIKGFLRRVIG